MFNFKNIVPVFNSKGEPIEISKLSLVDNINEFEFNIISEVNLDDWERIVVVTNSGISIHNLFLFNKKYVFNFSLWEGIEGTIPKDAFQSYWIDLDTNFWELNKIVKSEFSYGYIDNELDTSFLSNLFNNKIKDNDILPFINSNHVNNVVDFKFQ